MWSRKTDLVIVRRNLNVKGDVEYILRPVAVPFLRQHEGILMNDNARPHVATLTRIFLAQHNVPVLSWLPAHRT